MSQTEGLAPTIINTVSLKVTTRVLRTVAMLLCLSLCSAPLVASAATPEPIMKCKGMASGSMMMMGKGAHKCCPMKLKLRDVSVVQHRECCEIGEAPVVPTRESSGPTAPTNHVARVKPGSADLLKLTTSARTPFEFQSRYSRPVFEAKSEMRT